MALEGSLKEFGIADILQLIYYQRKTGVLTVDAGFDRIRLLFYEGNIVFAESSKRSESRVGKLLQKKGLITEQHLADALELQKASGARLGSILLKMNAISKDDLAETLKHQFTEFVSYIFTWRQGRYEFKPQGIPIDKDIPISLDTQHILMDGLRILDEWAAVEGKITLESVFVKAEHLAPAPPEAEITPLTPEAELTPEEQEVLGLVDGENDVSEISGLSGLDNFQVSKALLSLFGKGLIEKKKLPEQAALREKAKQKTLPDYLLEAVLACLFALSFVFYLAQQPAGGSKPFSASEEIYNLRFLVELYKVEHGRYPDKMEKIGNPVDPWGKPYIYTQNEAGFTLFSAGPDGAAQTGDDIY